MPLPFGRKNYEESMMVRLSMPKRAKNARKRGMMSMSGQLSGITHFGDITALTGGEGAEVSLRCHKAGSSSLVSNGSVRAAQSSTGRINCCRVEFHGPRKRRKS